MNKNREFLLISKSKIGDKKNNIVSKQSISQLFMLLFY